MKNKISIIIPCYNLGEYVIPMIDSVKKNLDFDNDIEVIIIDDFSTDNTLQLISDNVDDRFTVIKNKMNLQVSETRNVGIKRASGNYYFFLDGDDLLNPNFHKLWRQALNNKVVRFFGSNNKAKLINLKKNFTLPVQPSSYIISSKFYDDNLAFIKGIIYEDNHFVCSFENALIDSGERKIKLIKSKLIHYTRDREGSIMNSTHSLSEIKKSYFAMKKMAGSRKNIYLFQLWFSFLPTFGSNHKLKVNAEEKKELESFLKSEFKLMKFFGLPILYKIRFLLYIVFRKGVI